MKYTGIPTIILSCKIKRKNFNKKESQFFSTKETLMQSKDKIQNKEININSKTLLKKNTEAIIIICFC